MMKLTIALFLAGTTQANLTTLKQNLAQLENKYTFENGVAQPETIYKDL
jgi:hypothetical protein